ncbi:MAG TPA: hypothetical protein VNG33_13430, partial [Polyangiaceae bacterium]|nr:hypothetical protein [Polyangiaceae bacterium]
MNGPERLRDSQGAARTLMAGARLEVPGASRKRALAFVGTAAAGTAVSGTAAAAATTSLVKGVVLCVCLGTVGGGLASLAVSETISRIETRAATTTRPATTHAVVPAPPPPAPVVPETLVAAPEPVAPAAPDHATTRDTRDARASSPALGVSGAAAPAVAAAATKSEPGPSLFEEQRSIESARAAVARGDSATALATLDDYERVYGGGQFGPEALALRVEALSAAGQLGRARSLAAEFQRRYPHHPLLTRVQGAA